MTAIDPKEFRNVLGHFPTGVTIVTSVVDGEPLGLTIGSFTSVSLDPPMVGFLPGTSSATWAAMQSSGSFCVNVLGTNQADECWTFAKPTEGSRFDGVAWHPSGTGSPILDASLAWIDCTIHEVYEMGDHLFVLGNVTELSAAEGEPLLFFKGSLGTFSKQ